MDGFKTLERKGINVSLAERISIGTLTVEVGTLNETVTVSGEAPMIQAQTGERSFTVTTEAVQNLPIASRNFGALAALTPGVVGTIRLRTQNSRTNFQIDGVSTVDSGAERAGASTEYGCHRRGQGAHVRLSGGVRPVERAADHRRHQERLEPVPRIGL